MTSERSASLFFQQRSYLGFFLLSWAVLGDAWIRGDLKVIEFRFVFSGEGTGKTSRKTTAAAQSQAPSPAAAPAHGPT